jgi:capsule polysaccharide export protein KpsE/RkpR
MRPGSDSGASKLSTLFWLLVMAALVYAAWNAGPAYVAHLKFQDRLEEIARTGLGANSQRRVQESLEKTIREFGLTDYLTVSDCNITMEEMQRVIVCSYEREVRFLPGFSRVIRFNNKARQSVF